VKCWVCLRQARGFGHADERFGVKAHERFPTDWVFCSRRCQNAFHTLYGNWVRLQRGLPPGSEVVMIDPSAIEQNAMHRCLRFFGEAAAEIGFEKPLGQYSEAEALAVIKAIVSGYTEAMVEHHEASKFPPQRAASSGFSENSETLFKRSDGQDSGLTADPMAVSLADIEDDLPWETDKPASKNKSQGVR